MKNYSKIEEIFKISKRFKFDPFGSTFKYEIIKQVSVKFRPREEKAQSSEIIIIRKFVIKFKHNTTGVPAPMNRTSFHTISFTITSYQNGYYSPPCTQGRKPLGGRQLLHSSFANLCLFFTFFFLSFSPSFSLSSLFSREYC